MASFSSLPDKLACCAQEKPCLLKHRGLCQEFRLKKKYMKGLYAVELLAKRHGRRDTDGATCCCSWVLNMVQKLTATYGAQAIMKPELIMKAICKEKGTGDTGRGTKKLVNPVSQSLPAAWEHDFTRVIFRSMLPHWKSSLWMDWYARCSFQAMPK